MPVGAAIGTAVVGVGGSILSADAQKSATNKAIDAQQQSSAQQLALLQGLYAQNSANEQPYLNAGYGALQTQEMLLGLKPETSSQFNAGQWYQPGTVNYFPQASTPATGTPAPAPAPAPEPAPAPVSGYTGPSLSTIMSMGKRQGQPLIDAYMSYYQSHPNEDPGFSNISMFQGDQFKDESTASAVLAARSGYQASNPLPVAGSAATGGVAGGATSFPAYGNNAPVSPSAAVIGSVQPTAPATVTPTTGTAPAPAALLSPTDIIKQTPNYQFNLDQGLNALNANAYARGLGNSGATMKGLEQYGQNYANNIYQQYLANVGNMAQGGASAAGALAGVSQNYGNASNGINQSLADVTSKGLMTNGAATAQMWNGIGSSLGNLMGSSSFQGALKGI